MYEPKYRAVIFDLDGTLLNTLEDIGDSMNRVLEARGLPQYDIDEYRYLVGSGIRMLVYRVLPEEERSDELVQECVNEFREIYDKNWNVKTRPYEGVPEMLDEIMKTRLKVSILSNKPDDFTKKCVDEFLPAWKFKNVVGLNAGIPPKPDPTGALEIAERLRIKPVNFLYIGDTSIDMQTAGSAGMFPAGVLWGFRSADELLEHGAKALVRHPMEILNLLV